jgi:hypothetical protein
VKVDDAAPLVLGDFGEGDFSTWPSSLTVRPQLRAKTRRSRMVNRRHNSGARALNSTEPVWS